MLDNLDALCTPCIQWSSAVVCIQFFVVLVKFTQILALAHVFSFVVSKYELYCSTIFTYVHVTLVLNQSCGSETVLN